MGEAVSRARRLARHFLTSTALPAFAIVKSLELWILSGSVPGRMVGATTALVGVWIVAAWRDDVSNVVDEAADSAADAIDDAFDRSGSP